MSRLIQIGNLPDSVDGLGLERLFASHGAVHASQISIHFDSGRSTGVGFIEMESDEHGQAAIAALNHQEHWGRVLSVCWSETSHILVADHQQMFGPMNMTNGGTTAKDGDLR